MHDVVYNYIETKVDVISPAINLCEIKDYLKLNRHNEAIDGELRLFCAAALAYAEKYSRALFTPTIVKTQRLFWGEYRNGVYWDKFILRRGPLKEITSITYDGIELESEKYSVVSKKYGYSEVYFNGIMPELKTDWAPIEIEFIGGYEEIPSDVKLAMLQHIASMWLNRGDYDNLSMKCPQMSKDIYKKYKVMEVGA